MAETVLDGRYRLDALLARGGMADVYRAHDVRLGRGVAVKVLREVEHQERFTAEARTLARLSHPNLVALLDAGTYEDRSYLVLELVEGPTLSEVLRDGPLDERRTRDLGVAVAAALGYIHARGIVHRDVKPSNLMFDGEGTVRLADFGIARLVGAASLTASHQTVGTMPYLAPEQLQGEEVSAAADVYSLGLVLLECLTGRRAFEGAPAEAGLARLSRDPDVPGTLPPSLAALLGAMTHRDPAVRPSAEQVGALLEGRDAGDEATLAAVPVGATDATMAAAEDATAVAPGPPAPVRRRRSVGAVVALALAIVALGAVVVLAILALADEGGGGRGPAATTTTTAPTTTTTAPTTTTTAPTTTTTAPTTTTTAPPTTTTVPTTTVPPTTTTPPET